VGDISFVEWFFFGMPFELVLVFLVLGAVGLIGSLISGLFSRKDR